MTYDPYPADPSRSSVPPEAAPGFDLPPAAPMTPPPATEAYPATEAFPAEQSFPAEQPYPAAQSYAAPTYENADGDQSATDRASAAAETGKQAAGEVAQTAVDKAKNVADESKQQARNVLSEAQDQLREQATVQHRSAVTNLHALADELQAMVHGSDQDGPATDLVSRAGERTRSVASWLDDREPGQLVDEVRSFARRRPGAFLVGAVAAGVLAGRLTRGVAAAHSEDDATTTGRASGTDAGTQVTNRPMPGTDGPLGAPDAAFGSPTRHGYPTEPEPWTPPPGGVPASGGIAPAGGVAGSGGFVEQPTPDFRP